MKKKKLNYVKKYILPNERIYIVTYKNYNYNIFTNQSKWDKNIITNFN